uniref:Mce/MlaD domain-containing protein n=1 Tax=Chondria sp. (in: red algae) TaxID=1982705 RepID=A0A1Z1MQN9_9FLOR|nr:hypothetical protein [Chondria sp. (in: red algae)]
MSNIFDLSYGYLVKYLKKKLNILISIFFITVCILSLISLNRTGYNVFIEFNNAYRIKRGTNVNLKGVLVGYVDTITIRSNKVIILLRINSLNILIPRNSLIEANQIGLFNDIVIDITPPNNFKSSYNINPKSIDCIDSSFICSNFYLKGYKGLNYDDLVRATTRISQRFDDPRFFSLFYLLLHNLVDISDEVVYSAHSIANCIYVLSDLTTIFLLRYFV